MLMASSLFLRAWCPLLLLLAMAATRCKSDQDPVDIVASAMHCFNDQYVYTSCQESYRLNEHGNIDVPQAATDEYCSGPCLVETELVLKCIDSILYNFKFYNGASIQDVKYTLSTGCGHTSKRGDFNVLERLEGYDGGEYGHGEKPAIPMNLILLTCGLLLWAY